MDIKNEWTPPPFHKKYGYIDDECIALCDAINKLDGLETTYSCCGHNKGFFYIFVNPKSDIHKLAKLNEVLQKVIHWLPMEQWQIRVDSRGDHISFLLHSESVGKQAVEESNVIAMIINKVVEPIGTDVQFDNKWNQ
jgi:hypothetical protein